VSVALRKKKHTSLAENTGTPAQTATT